jgi:hypothetical protein
VVASKSKLLIGDRVELCLFNSSLEPPTGTKPSDNYWRLIDACGIVLQTSTESGIQSDRVLVRFDVDVAALGLACHNPLPNSLWIKRSDLRRIFKS